MGLVIYMMASSMARLRLLVTAKAIKEPGYATMISHVLHCRNKKKLGSPIAKSTGRLIAYHLGSVAFGAFIIAVVQLARLILAYIKKK